MRPGHLGWVRGLLEPVVSPGLKLVRAVLRLQTPSSSHLCSEKRRKRRVDALLIREQGEGSRLGGSLAFFPRLLIDGLVLLVLLGCFVRAIVGGLAFRHGAIRSSLRVPMFRFRIKPLLHSFFELRSGFCLIDKVHRLSRSGLAWPGRKRARDGIGAEPSCDAPPAFT